MSAVLQYLWAEITLHGRYSNMEGIIIVAFAVVGTCVFFCMLTNK